MPTRWLRCWCSVDCEGRRVVGGGGEGDGRETRLREKSRKRKRRRREMCRGRWSVVAAGWSGVATEGAWGWRWRREGCCPRSTAASVLGERVGGAWRRGASLGGGGGRKAAGAAAAASQPPWLLHVAASVIPGIKSACPRSLCFDGCHRHTTRGALGVLGRGVVRKL